MTLYYVNISHIMLHTITTYLTCFFLSLFFILHSFLIYTFYFIYLFIFIVSPIYSILHMFIIPYYLPLSHLQALVHCLYSLIILVWCTCPPCHLVFHITSPEKKKKKKKDCFTSGQWSRCARRWEEKLSALESKITPYKSAPRLPHPPQASKGLHWWTNGSLHWPVSSLSRCSWHDGSQRNYFKLMVALLERGQSNSKRVPRHYWQGPDRKSKRVIRNDHMESSRNHTYRVGVMVLTVHGIEPQDTCSKW